MILAVRGCSVDQLCFFATTFAIVSLIFASVTLAFYGSLTKAAFAVLTITVAVVSGANLFIIYAISHIG